MCNQPDKYKPSPNSWFVCSVCVQHLLKFSQDELKAGLKLAEKKGFERKIIALKMFIRPEDTNEQRKPIKKYERHLNRERGTRIIRNQKKLVR